MTNKQTYLGEFEHLVLLSIYHLNANAYGVTIRQHLKKTIDRDVSIGALYSTAERLEKKGYITSKKGEAKAERGGKAKRYFTITTKGLSSLTETRSKLESMWNTLPELYVQGVSE